MTDISGEGVEWESGGSAEEQADVRNLFDRLRPAITGDSEGGNGGAAVSGDGGGADDRPQRQTITVTRDLNRQALFVEQVLRTQNRDEVFVNLGELTVIGRDNKDEPILQKMHEAVFTRWLSANANWVANNEAQEVMSPMDAAVKAVYHDMSRIRARCGVPVVEQIATMPFFTASGDIVDTPGYCREARTWLEPAESVTVPEVPRNPSKTEVALALILSDLLVDFPFANEASRAHALALVLVPFMRDMIDGPTPLHAIYAPVAGSGKGKLTKLCLLPAMGRMPSTTSFPKGDGPMEKKLTAMLIAGRRMIIFDNANGKRESELLASATTEAYWSERVLGESREVDVQIRNIWAINGNNVTLSGELARRAAPRIRLDPGRVVTDAHIAANPHLRKGFKHPQLDIWATEHLGELAWAALVMVQSWIVAGRPEWSGNALGSYESWSLMVGGVLEHLGVGGFLSELGQDDDAIAERDAEEEMVLAWWGKFGDKAIPPIEFHRANLTDLFGLDVSVYGLSDRAISMKISDVLRKYKDRTIAGYTVKHVPSARGWKLEVYTGEMVGEETG